MRRFSLLITALFISLLAAAHAYHASIMELHYNASKQQLEVSLKVFTDDFEKALSTGQPISISLDQSPKPQVTALVTALLRRSVVFGTKPGEALPIQFIGIQKETDAHWLYFAVKLAKPVNGIYLRHSLLEDTFPDQMNIVNVEANGKKQSALFKDGDESQKLAW
ncbi:DUF6702 family protein [Hymenobacter crusticola]|uniref:Uncharacterized protein n=1 Tax=Hymenobacter crusticola TaxID=1770526 RepID=A0A243WI83_9BACT|nr:DUF6702 family protein [Hymenobacter crusticola]OUJ75527.1 hypothetical protein BXP70_05830 [Hymenobacter crusticola]